MSGLTFEGGAARVRRRLRQLVHKVRAATSPPAIAPNPVDRERTEVIDGLASFRLPPEVAEPRADLLEIGEHSFNRPIVRWHAGDTACARIGRYCCVHATVNIFVGGEHRMDWVTQYTIRERFDLPGAFVSGAPMTRGDVIIGNDVYIAFDVTILSGVHIGDGAVIGAGALVTSDVPAYAVFGGVPARHIRWRFEEAQRESLQRIKWWDWPDEKVIENVDLLNGPDIAAFLTKHDPDYA